MLDGPLPIETLVPHRGPMLLISEIISYDNQQATTVAVVKECWPLTTQSGANPLVLIELVAQTAAVNNGWRLIQDQGPDGDRRGWIVGIKFARLLVDCIPVGTAVTIECCNQFAYDNFREIRGIARIGDQIAAEVDLQLMQADSSTRT